MATTQRWVIDYAKWKYEEKQKGWQALDDKADKLITYLGGGVPILISAVVFMVDDVGPWVGLAAMPAVIWLIIALLQALRSRNVGRYSSPPSVGIAQSCLEKKGDGSEFAFVADLGRAAEALGKNNNRKSGQIDRAFNCLWWGVLLLILPIVVAIVSQFCESFSCKPEPPSRVSVSVLSTSSPHFSSSWS